MHLLLQGQVPAQKNNKSVGVTKSGRTFVASSKIVKDWQKETLKYLNLLNKKLPRKRLRIDYKFYVKDNRPRDTDNMIQSVNDILQVACADPYIDHRGKKKLKKGTGMIAGDHWQVLQLGTTHVEIDRDNPRADLWIIEDEA